MAIKETIWIKHNSLKSAKVLNINSINVEVKEILGKQVIYKEKTIRFSKI